MIKVEHLYKNYSEDIKVLKDINFTFEDGKTYAIIGSSGGGKSTFIVKGDQASFNGGANRGVINIAQIESLVQALQKDLLIASSGSNLSQWMASEMPKMEDKKLSH